MKLHRFRHEFAERHRFKAPRLRTPGAGRTDRCAGRPQQRGTQPEITKDAAKSLTSRCPRKCQTTHESSPHYQRKRSLEPRPEG